MLVEGKRVGRGDGNVYGVCVRVGWWGKKK
jgi:hypothetical protein